MLHFEFQRQEKNDTLTLTTQCGGELTFKLVD